MKPLYGQSYLICFLPENSRKINRQPPAVLKPGISIKTLRLVFGVGHTSLASAVHIATFGLGMAWDYRVGA